MYNSIIINKTIKLLNTFIIYYNNSLFNNAFLKGDQYIKNYVLNSIIVKALISPNNSALFQNSVFNNVFSKSLSVIRLTYPFIKKCIISSCLINLCKESIDKTTKHPIRSLAIFGISFAISNIIFGLLIGNINLLLLFWLIIAIALIPLLKATVSLKKLLMESYFYNFFKWIIS